MLAVGFGQVGQAAAQVRYFTVALSGQPAPGTSAGVSYSILSVPVLNDAGQAAYGAKLVGSSVTDANDDAIYAGPYAAPQLVARAGDAAPGTAAGVNYRAFDSPALNDSGQAAYRAFLTGSGVTTANEWAIYGGPLAAPQLVAREGDAAPGTPAGVHYAFFDPPVLNDVGQAAYFADLAGSGVTFANNEAIYGGPLAAPQLVARTGNAAPGTMLGVNYSFLDPPALNDLGQIAYGASLTGVSVTNATDRAIYAGTLAAPQLVARTGDYAPGTFGGVRYSSLSRQPVLNDLGQAAFFARLSGFGVTDSNDEAIYAGLLGNFQLVARTGDAAPGTPTGVNYASLSTSATLNDAGQVAYFADLAGSGVTAANDQAIFAGPLGAPQLVARTGDAAPGTPAGVTYASFFHVPALNDAGQAAYLATLSGSGVTPANDRGLFVSVPAVGELMIAREGDLFDVGGGDFRTIAAGGTGIFFVNGGVNFYAGHSDDAMTGLSNDGTLAFRLSFTDGTSGIFTATIVPEPGAMVLVAAGLMLVGGRWAHGRRPKRNA